MKTAISALQEMMVLQGLIPKYDCMAQSGPPHMPMFEYQCTAHNISVRATARSKKDAKQEAARIMLLTLADHGYSVPPQFRHVDVPVLILSPPEISCPEAEAPAVVQPLARSFVALLKELCDEHRLSGVEYQLTEDTGPPHARRFTIRASLGEHHRQATATTKKVARQLAAEQLYNYLKENLSNVTNDVVQDEELVRAYEKAMDCFVKTSKVHTRRPNFRVKVTDYHLALLTTIDETKRKLAAKTLVACEGMPAREALQAVVKALDLTVERDMLPTRNGKGLTVLLLSPTTPDLAMAGHTYEEAAADALSYISRALIVA